MSLVHISRDRKAVEIPGCPPYSQSTALLAWPNRAGRKFAAAAVRGQIWLNEGLKHIAEKRKTRPGGQPDGSSYMGAWGGWALAPNTASMGRDNRSHICWSQKGRRTFKSPCDFFLLLGR